jgi:ParB/RepB/Spo0J family partition protein
MTYSTTTIGQLVRWEGNPRPQATPESRRELRASIIDKGVQMPLIVRHRSGPNSGPGRIDEVLGGDTRRDIVAELAAEGLWPADREINVIVRDDLIGNDAGALDVALSDNINVPMHAMDQFHAFNQMVEMGREIREIANAYGVSPRIVEQRMSYAKLDERARVLVKENKRDLDWAAAMTLASADEQKQMLDEIVDDPRRYNTGNDVRRLLEGELISTKHALFDVATVKDALVRKDLFDTRDAAYMKRSEFQPLQDRALDELVGRRRAEGWSAVSVVSDRDFDRYRYNDGIVEKQLAEVVFVRHSSGEIVEHAGLALRIEERLNRMDVVDVDAGEALFGETAEEAREGAVIARAQITNDVRVVEGRKTARYTSVSKAVIIQAAMMQDPRLTIAVAVAAMVMSSSPKPIEGKVFTDLTEMDPSNPARIIVERRLDAARQIMDAGGIDPTLGYGEVITRLLALDDAQLMTLLQVSIAKRVTTDMQRSDMLFDAVMDQEGALLQTYWRPDRTYLSTLTKDAIEALAATILPPRALSKLTGSKGDLVEALAQTIDDAHEGGMRLGEAEREVVTSWAPKSLGGAVAASTIFGGDEANDDGASIFANAA